MTLPQCQLAGEVGAEGLIEAERAGISAATRRRRRKRLPAVYAVERARARDGLVLEGEFDGGDLGGIAVVRWRMSRFLTLPSWRRIRGGRWTGRFLPLEEARGAGYVHVHTIKSKNIQ